MYGYDIDWDDPELWTQPVSASPTEISGKDANQRVFAFYDNYLYSQQAYGSKEPELASMFMSPLREKHATADKDWIRANLDPGYDKFKDFKRSQAHRAHTEAAQHRKKQRAEAYAIKSVGAKRQDLTQEQIDALVDLVEQSKRDRGINAMLVTYISDSQEVSITTAKTRLKELSDDEKDRTELEARNAGYCPTSGEGGDAGDYCQHVGEQPTGPLPTEEEVKWSRYPIHKIPDKEAIREKLARDTERFLADGGEIEQMPYRGDPKPLPFNRW